MLGRRQSKDFAGGINISNKLRQNYVFPIAAFLEFPDTHGYSEYRSVGDGKDALFEDKANVTWRIDGASFGQRFNAVPLSWRDLRPARIDVLIPDQTQWPPELWDALDARDSVHLSRARVKSLGISHYLLEVCHFRYILCRCSRCLPSQHLSALCFNATSYEQWTRQLTQQREALNQRSIIFPK